MEGGIVVNYAVLSYYYYWTICDNSVGGGARPM